MIALLVAVTWFVTGVGAVLLIAAAVGRLPAPLAFVLIGLAEAAVLAGVVADVVGLAGGWRPPDLPTHLGYLIALPFIIPAGLALTYRKIDRWGLLILGVATLVAAIMVVRQVQTLGVPFGYLNLA